MTGVEVVLVVGSLFAAGYAIIAAANASQRAALWFALSYLIGMLAPVSDEVAKYKFLTPTERETVLERLSVRNSINNLRTFPYVKEREADGRLRLHGAWFDISTGELWVMNPETGDFSRPELPPEA